MSSLSSVSSSSCDLSVSSLTSNSHLTALSDSLVRNNTSSERYKKLESFLSDPNDMSFASHFLADVMSYLDFNKLDLSPEMEKIVELNGRLALARPELVCSKWRNVFFNVYTHRIFSSNMVYSLSTANDIYNGSIKDDRFTKISSARNFSKIEEIYLDHVKFLTKFESPELPSVHSLAVHSCSHISNEGFSTIARNFPALTNLVIWMTPNQDSIALEHLSSLTSLTALEIRNNSGIPNRLKSLTKLTKLKLYLGEWGNSEFSSKVTVINDFLRYYPLLKEFAFSTRTGPTTRNNLLEVIPMLNTLAIHCLRLESLSVDFLMDDTSAVFQIEGIFPNLIQFNSLDRKVWNSLELEYLKSRFPKVKSLMTDNNPKVESILEYLKSRFPKVHSLMTENTPRVELITEDVDEDE